MGPQLSDEGPELQLAHRLPQFRLRVHHDRPVPRDWLLDGLTRNQQEPDPLIARLDDDLVSAVEEHERSIAKVILAVFQLVADRARLGGVAERAAPGEHIRKRVTRALNGNGAARARRHRDVEVAWVGGDTFDRP